MEEEGEESADARWMSLSYPMRFLTCEKHVWVKEKVSRDRGYTERWAVASWGSWR